MFNFPSVKVTSLSEVQANSNIINNKKKETAGELLGYKVSTNPQNFEKDSIPVIKSFTKYVKTQMDSTIDSLEKVSKEPSGRQLSLPPEILFLVFGFLSIKDACSAKLASREFLLAADLEASHNKYSFIKKLTSVSESALFKRFPDSYSMVEEIIEKITQLDSLVFFKSEASKLLDEIDYSLYFYNLLNKDFVGSRREGLNTLAFVLKKVIHIAFHFGMQEEAIEALCDPCWKKICQDPRTIEDMDLILQKYILIYYYEKDKWEEALLFVKTLPNLPRSLNDGIIRRMIMRILTTLYPHAPMIHGQCKTISWKFPFAAFKAIEQGAPQYLSESFCSDLKEILAQGGQVRKRTCDLLRVDKPLFF